MSEESGNRQKYQRDYRANARKLRSLRTRAHLSLKGLESKAGINFTTINRIEKGHNRSPQWSTLEALAAVFDVDVDELVIYLDDTPELTDENRSRLAEVDADWDRLDALAEEEKAQGENEAGG